jgi:hypothetical protein
VLLQVEGFRRVTGDDGAMSIEIWFQNADVHRRQRP